MSPDEALKVPMIEDPPEWERDGAWRFIEGPPVTKIQHESIVSMIGQMNRGIANLPDLRG